MGDMMGASRRSRSFEPAVVLLRVVVLLLVLLPAGTPSAAAGRATILVYGDSLSAAYGIGQKQGWVALLEERLGRSALDYSVVNASISGETSSGGASRIGSVLSRTRPSITIVELGGNDGLRGLPPAQMRENLSTIVGAARRAGSRVLLLGMQMPPNYGAAYAREFERVYADVARQHKATLAPFFPDGAATRRDFFQDDNIHPTAAAQPLILEQVWKHLSPMLGAARVPTAARK
jgi:acyl-CoA thioesterase-1